MPTSDSICGHTFRSSGLSIALENGSTLEEAQPPANHADIRTTMLFDRRDQTVKRGVVERIIICDWVRPIQSKSRF